MDTIMISDLHLSAATPELNRLFFRQLKAWAGQIAELYILGDLFDVWVGDDDDDATAAQIMAAMHEFSRHTPLKVMHGNRDFLLGKGFAEKSGAELIDEPYELEVGGKVFVLAHGDVLCTLDEDYQRFRAQARHPLWQSAVLAKPLAERRLLAGQIRAMSEIKKDGAGLDEKTDATQEGVAQLLAPFAAAGKSLVALIHGHTHRPAVHEHEVAGKRVRRWVIRDWEAGRGGGLCIDEYGTLSAFELSL